MFDADRFADGIAGYARQHGLKRICRRQQRDGRHLGRHCEQQYEASARSAGLVIRIIDRASCPRNRLERRSAFPDDLENDTLAARIVRHPVAVDYLMGDKTALLRAMRRYRAAGS